MKADRSRYSNPSSNSCTRFSSSETGLHRLSIPKFLKKGEYIQVNSQILPNDDSRPHQKVPDMYISALSKDVARLAGDVGVEPLQEGSVCLNARVAPDLRGPAVLGPVGVDVSPAGKVVRLDHVDQAGEVLNGGSRVRGSRGLDTRLGNPLGLGGEVDVDEDVGVEDVTFAVDGVADRETDVVVEDGEAWVHVSCCDHMNVKSELTLVVDDIVTGIENLSGTTDGVVHEGNVGDLANNLVDVAVGGRVSLVVKGIEVKLGVVGVGVEVAGDFIVRAEEVLDAWRWLEANNTVKRPRILTWGTD